VLAADRVPLALLQIAQHLRARIGVVEVKLVDAPHKRQIAHRCRRGPR